MPQLSSLLPNRGIPPDILAKLKAAGAYGSVQGPDGTTYTSTGQEQNDQGGIGYTPTGFTSYAPGVAANTAGAQRAEYGLDGGFAQMGKNNAPSMKDALVPLGAVGMMMGLPGGPLNGLFGGAGAAGEAVDGGGTSFAGTGAELGGDVATNTPGFTSGLADTLASGAPEVGAGGGALTGTLGAGAAGTAGFSSGLGATMAGAPAASAGMFGLSPLQLMGYGQLASGVLGAGATLLAGNKAANAANNATALQKSMFDTVNGQQAPFRQAGADAATKLSSMLNTGPDGLLHNFGASDFTMDPGYQYQLKYGNQALQNSQAAGNGVLSGGSLKDLIGFNQDYAGQGFQSAYDRYMKNKASNFDMLNNTATLGENAAANTGNVGANISGGMANTTVGAGQAGAAGLTGAASALASGISGAGNSYLLSQFLNRQNPQSTSTQALMSNA